MNKNGFNKSLAVKQCEIYKISKGYRNQASKKKKEKKVEVWDTFI